MNAFLEMKQRHRREVDDLPLFFAFTNEQLDEELKKRGLNLKEASGKICCLGLCGCFYLKDDKTKIDDTFARHAKEKQEAIDSDTAGDGYIYDMFRYELNNHEYGYTWDTSDTLNALGLTMEEIEKSKPLINGFEKAIRYIKDKCT